MMPAANSIVGQLTAVIAERRRTLPEGSYTTTLFAGGVEAIGAKVCEEAAELVEAAGEPEGPEQHAHVVHEAADLVYHLLVLLAQANSSFDEVESELARRFGISGLDEKASRPQP